MQNFLKSDNKYPMSDIDAVRKSLVEKQMPSKPLVVSLAGRAFEWNRKNALQVELSPYLKSVLGIDDKAPCKPLPQ